jgi:hypothetical protein
MFSTLSNKIKIKNMKIIDKKQKTKVFWIEMQTNTKFMSRKWKTWISVAEVRNKWVYTTHSS